MLLYSEVSNRGLVILLYMNILAKLNDSQYDRGHDVFYVFNTKKCVSRTLVMVEYSAYSQKKV